MKKRLGVRICFLACVFVLCCLMSACNPAEEPVYETLPEESTTETVTGELLREIAPEELASGDRIVLYHDASGNLAGQYASSRFLAAVYGETAGADGQRTISQIQPDAAIFTAEKTENGWTLHCADRGYLTSGKNANQLTFNEEASELSLWALEDGGFWRNMHAENKDGANTLYLEYYNGITVYEKKEDSGEDLFRFSIFRLNPDYTEPEGGYVLPVFETSDVHGFLVDTSADPYQFRMARIADHVREARSRYGEYDPATAILLDSGDIYQGNAISDFVDGACMSAAYEMMDYDAVAIGNHDFDWEIETAVQADGTMHDYSVAGFEAVNDIPVINANIRKDGEKPDFASEYIVLEKTARNAAGEILPVRVGVIGYAEEYASSVIHNRFTGLGYSVSQDWAQINELARVLEEDLGCDATILLLHGGAGEMLAYLNADTMVDLVLGGHTHQVICGWDDHGIPFAQPGNKAATYAYANLVFDAADGETSLRWVEAVQTVSITEEVSRLHNTPENKENLDPDVLALSEAMLAELGDVLEQEIGYITESALKNTPIDGNGRSCTAGNWIASIFARAVDAQIGFVNKGGVRAEFVIPEGQDKLHFSVADLYTMLPFGTGIFAYEITCDELLGILEFALGNGDGLYSYLWGVECYYTDETVNALALNGEVIYENGVWNGDWKDRTVRIAVGEYIVTADNKGNLLFRPEMAGRMTASVAVDNEAAVEVLMNEAKENNGLLFVDPDPYLIEKEYTAK